jgi:hypothetical protein
MTRSVAIQNLRHPEEHAQRASRRTQARFVATAPALLLTLALATPAAAAKVVHPDDAVAGHPGLTYLDLVSREVRGLAPSQGDNGELQGHLPDPPPRHIGGKSLEGETPDPVTLGFVEDERIVAGGKPRMVILADLGPDPDRAQSQTLLLLFDDGPHPKLLDAVDVGLDKDTELDEQTPKLSLGPGDDALVTISEHSDADISFDGRNLLFVRHDRFEPIASFFVINSQACGWKQVETPSFAMHPDPGQPYASVSVTVRHAIVHVDEDGCGDPIPKTMRRTLTSVYRWSGKLGRFVAAPDGLKHLDKLSGAGS